MRGFTQFVSAAAILCLADMASAQCRLIAVHDEAAVSGQSITIRVGSFESLWSTPVTTSFANRALGLFVRPKELPFKLDDERLKRIEVAFSEILTEILASPGRVPLTSGARSTDLVLHAEITGVDPGNRAARAIMGSGRAFAAVRAVLASNEGRPLAAVTCDRSTAGGLFGEGGWIAFWQSGESLLRKNLRKIAQSLARELGRSEQVAQRLAVRRQDKVEVGELRYRTRKWLDHPPERWSLKDSTSIFANFMTQTSRTKMLGGPPILTRGVHALWLTGPAYQALRRSHELLSQGDESVWVHPFSLAFDENTFGVIESEPAYAMAVWPFDKAPFYWNQDAIMAATFLRRQGQADERIEPIAFVGQPWPPAVFLFPKTTPDGKRLIDSLDMTVELHTTLNGRQIVSRFDLARFGLRDVNELDLPRSNGNE